jgi:hypothetical protein
MGLLRDDTRALCGFGGAWNVFRQMACNGQPQGNQ